MTSYLLLIDHETDGRRCDVTPVFRDYTEFAALVNDLSARFDGVTLDLVAGIDSLGFILGTALAMHFRKGFVTVRKGGKLPVQWDRVEFVDYSGQPKSLELRPGAIEPGAHVLLVDEWIETGAQAKAAIALIEGQGGVISGIATIGADRNENTRPLFEKYNLQAIGPIE